ncbi:MAG: hypothetical protein EOO73_32215 [Myxococcales bacterium]|nr:MAG: hypothetical protein EOO73_32215 [Myxococcales bacterium]
MRHAQFALLCASALVAASACGSDDERPLPSVEGGSGSSSSGGKSSRAGSGSGSQPEVGGEPSSEAGGAVGLGGEGGGGGGDGIVYETAGAPTFIPGLCDPQMMPGKSTALELEPPLAGATLLATTPDELSVALAAGDDPELRLYVGDRASADDPFEVQEIALPPGYEAASGVALSSDALILVLVLADHSGFGAISRPERGEPFSTDANVTAFTRLNGQKAMSGRSLGWPVLASDGGTLYFLSYFGQGLVVQSTRGSDGRFDLGSEIDEFTLGGGEGAYKRIHSVSADQRAIFFFDEATQHSMALFRSRPNAPFYEPLDLGDRRGAAPNADCSRLYSSVDGALVAQALE